MKPARRVIAGRTIPYRIVLNGIVAATFIHFAKRWVALPVEGKPHRVVLVMGRPRLAIILLSTVLAAGAGCSLFEEAHKPQYETVQADPRHETAVAEAEHAQALKLLNEPSCCTGCNPCKAEEHLQKALVADVTYGPAHNTLGMLYLRQQKFYLAAWEFEYAQKLMPDRFEPLYNLGLVYEAADKLDRAIEFYSMAFSLSPRTPQVLESLARARLRNGEPVASVRPLLKEILFYETRPVWVCWAKDRLGLAPEKSVQNDFPPPPLPANDRRTNKSRERVPETPVPDDSSAPAPKVANPNPKHQLSPSPDIGSDVFSELSEPGSSDAPASVPLAVTTSAKKPQGAAAPIIERMGSASSASASAAESWSETPNSSQPSDTAVPASAAEKSTAGRLAPFCDESLKSIP